MTSTYKKEFEIPSGFPEILQRLTKEIIRDNPGNIYEYAARHFEDEMYRREAELVEDFTDDETQPTNTNTITSVKYEHVMNQHFTQDI